MIKSKSIALVLPSCGLNHLWQLGAIYALYKLGLENRVKKVYACSGGAWTAIFLGLGMDVVSDYLSRAPSYFERWQQNNKYSFFRRMGPALSDDTEAILKQYNFFERFNPGFECYFKLLQVYPKPGIKFVHVNNLSSKEVHKLAVASSTIPFITGTVAQVKNRLFLDGGFRPGFREIHNCSEKTVVLDTRSNIRMPSAFIVRPTQPLSSGLKLGLPFRHSEQKIRKLIYNGYVSVMLRKEKLFDFINAASENNDGACEIKPCTACKFKEVF